MMSPKWRNNL